MRKFGTALTTIGILLVALTTPAMANGLTSWRLCGGNNFSTCTAVEVSVIGNSVTMRVWNLSQNTGAAYGLGKNGFGGSILDGIAFFNLPAGLQVDTASLNVTGPDGNAGQGWSLKNYGTVGAFAIDGRNGPGHAATAGIASGCGASAQNVTNLMTTPCTALNTPGSWVTFTFQINGPWNPNNSDLTVRSYDPGTGTPNEFWTGMSPGGQEGLATTVTPEPVTMTLLATGLAGMGGAGFLRRRRKGDEV